MCVRKLKSSREPRGETLQIVPVLLLTGQCVLLGLSNLIQLVPDDKVSQRDIPPVPD